MTARLRWQRDGKGGFIAYPEGEDFKGRRAEISRNSASGGSPWAWFVSYDKGKAAGIAVTQQEAADKATAAWPEVMQEGIDAARKDADDEALRTLVQRMATKGDLSLEVFDIPGSSSERLKHIIWLFTHGGVGSLTGPGRSLVEACSVELGRRRGVR